jgi:hypothetical protein
MRNKSGSEDDGTLSDVLRSEKTEICGVLEYAYFVIFPTSLALVFIYCRYKFEFAKLINDDKDLNKMGIIM